MNSTIKFYWNGFKVDGGKLVRCTYGFMENGSATGKYPAGAITIYGRDYGRWPAGFAEVFAIENESDCQTDYFETNRTRVMPSHPLYAQVKSAHDAARAHYAKMQAVVDAKLAARRAARQNIAA